MDVVTSWYKERATEIEECSGQVYMHARAECISGGSVVCVWHVYGVGVISYAMYI